MDQNINNQIPVPKPPKPEQLKDVTNSSVPTSLVLISQDSNSEKNRKNISKILVIIWLLFLGIYIIFGNLNFSNSTDFFIISWFCFLALTVLNSKLDIPVTLWPFWGYILFGIILNSIMYDINHPCVGCSSFDIISFIGFNVFFLLSALLPNTIYFFIDFDLLLTQINPLFSLLPLIFIIIGIMGVIAINLFLKNRKIGYTLMNFLIGILIFVTLLSWILFFSKIDDFALFYVVFPLGHTLTTILVYDAVRRTKLKAVEATRNVSDISF